MQIRSQGKSQGRKFLSSQSNRNVFLIWIKLSFSYSISVSASNFMAMFFYLFTVSNIICYNNNEKWKMY